MKLEIGTIPDETGILPDSMKAWVIREERHGTPLTAFQLEDMPIPEITRSEVLVMVMAAGINYNNVWAALGKPLPVSRLHPGIPHHIGGSDASGIVWKVGPDVTRWKLGDEVIVHPAQYCGQCPACLGLDPIACPQLKAWGYETSWGAFAQFTKVQSQQLLPKPPRLSWEEAASYGLSYFTTYRMLVDRCRLKAGDNVLIWGAGGGLGVYAIQLTKLFGANAIAIVSSDEKIALCRQLGADWVIDRRKYRFNWQENETPEKEKNRKQEMARFRDDIRFLTGGRDPDIVFEHPGKETFATSVFVCGRLGKIVICGASTGYNLHFDVRHLWMMQKTIVGSHGNDAYQAERANRLIEEGKIKPYVDEIFPFDHLPAAHQKMLENKHKGKMVVMVQGAMQPGSRVPFERGWAIPLPNTPPPNRPDRL